MKILIIDDDNRLVRGMRQLFRLHGHEAVGHNGGSDVLMVARQENPDVVLLDVDLGDIDGRTLCACIKHEARIKPLPVLLVSGRPDGSDEMARACGADAFVAKPFSVSHLLATVRSVARARIGA